MTGVYTDLYLDTYGSTMALRRMFDAAYPPTNPPEWEAAAGYIGGNTPHVWSDAEWARQPARWRLPIFTRSVGGDPLQDAHASITWLVRHEVPRGVCMALDFETRVDPGYLATFDRAVVSAGWKVMVYGTRRTVVQNPEPSGGYWMAEWTGTPHLIPGSAATQWSGSGPFGGAYDPNLVADATRLWDTEGDFTVLDDATKTYLDGQFAALATKVQNGVLILMRGDETTDPTKDTHPDNLQRTRQDLAAGLSDISTKLAAGLQVTLDLSSATPEQLDQLAALIAGHVAIKGVGYAGTIDLSPKTP